MNFTISSLTFALLSSSPMLTSGSIFNSISTFNLNKMTIHKSLAHFLYFQSNFNHASIFKSNFYNFLDSPISINSIDSDEKIFKQETLNNQLEFTNDKCNSLSVVSCTFINCSSDKNGGAIRFLIPDSNISVYGTIFENCESTGFGGAIFLAANEEGDVEKAKTGYFNSSYCCYSRCSGSYGSAMLTSAKLTELFYSSSSECPKDERQKIGAQFDLNAEDIRSRFINATTGNSLYCAGIEYRNANNGFFEYQTLVNQKGGFITSFTNLNVTVEISYCNFVNETICDNNINDIQSAVLHIRKQNLEISHFCFLNIKFDFDSPNSSKCRLISYGKDDPNQKLTLTMINCTVEDSLSNDLLTEIKVVEMSTYEDGKFYTNTIDQLALGNCGGKKTVPPMFPETPFVDSPSTDSPSADSTFTDSPSADSPSPDFPFTDSPSDDSLFVDSDAKDKGLGTPEIAGIAVGSVAAAAAIAAVAAFFIIRAKRNPLNPEDISNVETTNSSTKTSNPLYGKGEDDPFKQDFNNYNDESTVL